MFFEVKIEESEKAGSRQESNPGHLACAASALPLSYDNRTTTSPHNPLYTPVAAGVFTFLYFRLKKHFFYSVRQVLSILYYTILYYTII